MYFCKQHCTIFHYCRFLAMPLQRWTTEETGLIAEVRDRLGDLLTGRPQYPDVVGDRKIIRFLRGHNNNVDSVCTKMTTFLQWRDTEGIDDIRNSILMGACNPAKFPKADIILDLIPQIVIAPDATDSHGALICFEQYSFSPAEVLERIGIKEYLVFVIYCLEFKMLILEQMSEEQEKNFLLERDTGNDDNLSDSDGYGVVLYTSVIRDLDGVGFDHLSPQGFEIIKSISDVATMNYPEIMHKCYIINAPWIFTAAWVIIQAFLSRRTLDKVALYGTDWKESIKDEIVSASLPSLIGGQYVEAVGQMFRFDLKYLSPQC